MAASRPSRLSARGFDHQDTVLFRALEMASVERSACGVAARALDRMRASIRALPEAAHDEHYRRTAIVSSAARRFNNRCGD